MDSAMQGVSARLWNVGSMGQRGVTLSMGALSLGRSISGLEPGVAHSKPRLAPLGVPTAFVPDYAPVQWRSLTKEAGAGLC